MYVYGVTIRSSSGGLSGTYFKKATLDRRRRVYSHYALLVKQLTRKNPVAETHFLVLWRSSARSFAIKAITRNKHLPALPILPYSLPARQCGVLEEPRTSTISAVLPQATFTQESYRPHPNRCEFDSYYAILTSDLQARTTMLNEATDAFRENPRSVGRHHLRPRTAAPTPRHTPNRPRPQPSFPRRGPHPTR